MRFCDGALGYFLGGSLDQKADHQFASSNASQPVHEDCGMTTTDFAFIACDGNPMEQAANPLPVEKHPAEGVDARVTKH